MTKLQTGLSGLLVLQLLTAAALFWGQQQSGQPGKRLALLSFQAETLDRVVVSDGEHSATLTKSGDAWILPNLQQLPADGDKLKDQLDKLQQLMTGWPVATTAASRQRFEVADDKFQRRLQLYHGDTPAGELLIGTSPGFRKSHVRRAGDDAVYAVKLNAYEWPAKDDDWLDKALLAAGGIERIEGGDYAVEKQDGGWRLVGEQASTASAEGQAPALDQEKTVQLASALGNLRVQSLAATAPDFDAPDGKAAALKVSGEKAEHRYRFLHTGDNYYVKRDDRKPVFTISQFDFDRIAAVNRSQLIGQAKPPNGDTPGNEGEQQ